MLEPTLRALHEGRVILASQSPRRFEIIKKLGIPVEVIPSIYDENLDRSKYDNHGDYIKDLAKYKVIEVYERLKNDSIPPMLIIGADTLVTMDDTIYGKPKDDSDAFRILSNLANKEHVVYTGVFIKTVKEDVSFYESAKVKIGDISQEQIKSYINTKEPMDKAGGYGIQGIGGCLIEKVNGDVHTVMGLPLYSLTKKLNQMYSI